MEQKEQLTALFNRYLNDQYTQQDVDILVGYFGSVESEKELRELIEQAMRQELDFRPIDAKIQDVSIKAFDAIQTHVRPRKIRLWPYYGAAAVLLAVLFSYLYMNNTVQFNPAQNLTDVHDIAPGGNRALLQTADGKEYHLDSDEGGIEIEGNMIQYGDGVALMKVDQVQVLKLRTPKGGTYYLQLEDGSKVWLNADSEIEYPSQFSEQERRVKIKGEVYFEVAKLAHKPFVVESEGQVIQVLGTSFNVNSYPDERNTYTTLLEGSIKLLAKVTEKEVYLKPNDLTVVSSNGLSRTQVDAQLATAWKEGVFRFNATLLNDALKQVQRWYDLDIDFNQIPKDIKVHAIIDRNKKLSSVLYAIEQVSNVKFKLTGRRLEIVN